jgi:hypothetical protein
MIAREGKSFYHEVHKEHKGAQKDIPRYNARPPKLVGRTKNGLMNSGRPTGKSNVAPSTYRARVNINPKPRFLALMKARMANAGGQVSGLDFNHTAPCGGDTDRWANVNGPQRMRTRMTSANVKKKLTNSALMDKSRSSPVKFWLK